MRALLFIAPVVLAACNAAPQVVSTSARTVVIKGATSDPAGAQVLADAECAKNRLFARMVARPNHQAFQHNYVFDCVP